GSKRIVASEDEHDPTVSRHIDIAERVVECVKVAPVPVREPQGTTHVFVETIEGEPALTRERMHDVPMLTEPCDICGKDRLAIVEADGAVLQDAQVEAACRLVVPHPRCHAASAPDDPVVDMTNRSRAEHCARPSMADP